jgi:hypothetical protein
MFSIGERSGEYGGKYNTLAPVDYINSFTPFTLWKETLSKITV